MSEVNVLRPEDVAKALQLGRSKVYEMIARGEIPVVRFGAAVRVPQKALDEWIEARTVRPTG